MMSSTQRKRELRILWEQQRQLHEAECNRKQALSLYDRIEEASISSEVKDILHRLAQGERE